MLFSEHEDIFVDDCFESSKSDTVHSFDGDTVYTVLSPDELCYDVVAKDTILSDNFHVGIGYAVNVVEMKCIEVAVIAIDEKCVLLSLGDNVRHCAEQSNKHKNKMPCFHRFAILWVIPFTVTRYTPMGRLPKLKAYSPSVAI